MLRKFLLKCVLGGSTLTKAREISTAVSLQAFQNNSGECLFRSRKIIKIRKKRKNGAFIKTRPLI